MEPELIQALENLAAIVTTVSWLLIGGFCGIGFILGTRSQV